MNANIPSSQNLQGLRQDDGQNMYTSTREHEAHNVSEQARRIIALPLGLRSLGTEVLRLRRQPEDDYIFSRDQIERIRQFHRMVRLRIEHEVAHLVTDVQNNPIALCHYLGTVT